MNLRKQILSTVAIVALAVLVFVGVLTAPALAQSSPASQSPTTSAPASLTAGDSLEAMETAGVEMEFDVASVKQNLSSDQAHSNVNLSSLEGSPATGGFLSSVSFPLSTYIGFAYKLSTNQRQFLQPQLPKWATTDKFDIEARAQGNPTRDQMRLMMQALLADRFKLAIHAETRQVPVLALVLARPGKTGPQLQLHSDDPPCAGPRSPDSAPTPPKDDGWLAPCGGLGARFVSDRIRVGSRNLTMGEIANHLLDISFGTLDRPVLDQTGLSGEFDLRIEFVPQPNGDLPTPPDFKPDPTGPTFLEALQEQLGLKLESAIGPIKVVVIDHVEEPTPN